MTSQKVTALFSTNIIAVISGGSRLCWLGGRGWSLWRYASQILACMYL